MFQSYATVASSIFLEGLLFLLLGVIASALIEVFVKEDTIQKIIPSNFFLALIVTSISGLIFPICECGIVPVVSRLIKKGFPVSLGITLMLSSPIVNVIVIAGTLTAFYTNPLIALFRTIGGFIIPITIGAIIRSGFKDSDILHRDFISHCHDQHCHCHNHHNNTGWGGKFRSIVSHASNDFIKTSKLFIMGILITAAIKVVLPESIFGIISKKFPLPNLFMLGFPYVLSVCSYTDAFIARSLANHFSYSPILNFLIFGAMFDIKTTLMLNGIFKKSFILKIIILTAVCVSIYTLSAEIIIKVIEICS